MNDLPITVEYYVTETGKEPYTEWFKRLRDPLAKAKIANCVDKVKLGNFGKCDPVGEGVVELKLDYGPGYRMYCLPDGDKLIILLCGGTKNGQSKDIKQAKEYAKDYKRSR